MAHSPRHLNRQAKQGHRERDQHPGQGNQKYIMDRLAGAQDNQRRRANRDREDEMHIRQHMVDVPSIGSKSHWDGCGKCIAPMGCLMPMRNLPTEASYESLVHYDLHPLMDKHPLDHEHFYDVNNGADVVEKPIKPKSSPTSRSKSVPPSASERRNRIGANFAVRRRDHQLPRISSPLHNDSDEETSTKYDSRVESAQSQSPPSERRRSRSRSPTRKSSDRSQRQQIEYKDSEDDLESRSRSRANSNAQNKDTLSPQDAEKQKEYPGAGDDYLRVGKKVSYSFESSDLHRNLEPLTKTNTLLTCRLRADCVEPDESDMNFSAKGGKRPSNSNSTINSDGLYSASTLEQNLSAVPSDTTQSESQPNLAMENFVGNKGDNNNTTRVMTTPSGASVRCSQECLHQMGRKPSNLYNNNKDVLPLPIEIPDSVADAEAFRRYLSVRRGAIRSTDRFDPFETTIKDPSSSYDSLGRRVGAGSSVGMTPSRQQNQISHEASRRTASLSHAIMTLALLSASICQLRFLITYSHAHSYPVLNYFLIFTSIILEVAAGIGYVMIARCSYDDSQTEAIHNYLIFALFIVAVSNVVLAAFAFDDHICGDINKTSGRSSTSPQQNQQINQPMPRADRVMDLRYMPLE